MYVYQLHRVVMFLFTLLLLACGGGGESGEAPAVDATDSADASGIAPDLSQAGNISGKVNFEGEQPEQPRIRMGAEPQCEHKHSGAIYSEVVVVNDWSLNAQVPLELVQFFLSVGPSNSTLSSV